MGVSHQSQGSKFGKVGKDEDRILANFHLQSIVSADFAIGFYETSFCNTTRNLLIYRVQHNVFSDFMVLAVYCQSRDQCDLFAVLHVLQE